MSRLRPEQDQCTGRVNAPVISIDMQYNTPKLSFKPIADDISPLIKISMSQEFDNGDHLLMGEGPCHFYLSCLDCDGKNSLARLCCDGANQLLAAFHLSLVEGSLTIKRASKAVAEDVLREIVDEVIRIVRKRDSLRSIYVSALPLLTEYIAFLRKCGFVEDSADGVYFEYDLRDEIPSSTVPNEVTIRDLDVLNEVEMRSRAIAQSSAFSDKDLESMGAWVMRNIQRMTEYRNLTGGTDLVAIDEDGLVISFAAFDLDKENSIGEFDPVGTLPRFQRKGFSRAVILDGLARMKKAGMTKAIVRTATFAIPAINAYQAIGFEEVDRSVRYTMPIKH